MKKLWIIIIVIAILICATAIGLKIYFNSNQNLIYQTTYGFALGSRRVKIYENGMIFDDLEIEDPNHQEDYKYVKKLTKNEINDLKLQIESGNSEETSNYVILLVYGVEEFDINGSY